MHLTVVSVPSADDELMVIWMQAGDKMAVRDAADTLERMLRDMPSHLVPPSRTRLQFTVTPLTVECEINPDDRLVTILTYRHTT